MTSFVAAERAVRTGHPADGSRLRLFSGSSNPALAREIAGYLGIPDGPRVSKRFADGELYIQIQESIRGCDVFLVQPTCAPVNDHLMELLIMVDACRRASARQITAVAPYYGYARADRKPLDGIHHSRWWPTCWCNPGEPRAGDGPALSPDSGVFRHSLRSHYGSPVLVDYLATRDLGEVVVVSPDVGGGPGLAFAKRMDDALAIIDKRRSAHNESESLTVIGDVAGKTAIVVDDMIDTGGTIAKGAKLLREKEQNG